MDLEKTVALLQEKNATVACGAWEALLRKSKEGQEVYAYFDRFAALLESKSAYERVRGFGLIAENARWDKENRIKGILDRILAQITDPKPIAARQCIQRLPQIAQEKPALAGQIREALTGADTGGYRESMRLLVQRDIDAALAQIGKAAAPQTE
ncbi:MAG: SufBD protein [Oscillospiraceae bacterium]|nr:SufBD protein [Oscillospiraceae bacterium]